MSKDHRQRISKLTLLSNIDALDGLYGQKVCFQFCVESRNQSYCRDHLILHYFHLLSSHPILIYPGSNIQCLTVVDCLTGQTVHKYVLSQISRDCGSNPFLKHSSPLVHFRELTETRLISIESQPKELLLCLWLL